MAGALEDAPSGVALVTVMAEFSPFVPPDLSQHPEKYLDVDCSCGEQVPCYAVGQHMCVPTSTLVV